MNFFKNGATKVVIATSKRKVSKYDFPTLKVNAVKGKLGICSKAAELLGMANKDNIMFINNGEQGEDRMWAVLKAYEMLDSNGNVMTTKERLTDDERKAAIEVDDIVRNEKGEPVLNVKGNPIANSPIVSRFHGSRLSSHLSTEAGVTGLDLEGTDNSTWADLNGTVEHHQVYKFGEGIEVPFNEDTKEFDDESETTRTIYPIIPFTTEKKMDRPSKSKVASADPALDQGQDQGQDQDQDQD